MKTSPYGSWTSAITTDLLTADMTTLLEPQISHQQIYWLEGRPWEDGRHTLVAYQQDGSIKDLTQKPLNIKSRVHEYGGGACRIQNGKIFFIEKTDQQLYLLDHSKSPQKITSSPYMRFAEPVYDEQRNQIICICEDHSPPHETPENSLVAIDLDTKIIQTLQTGNDFYSSPSLSPDGKYLSWITWNHPSMPWDQTECWIANLSEEGSLKRVEKIAGDKNESICQPKWSPNGELYFLSDRTGWWNIYHWNQNEEIKPVLEMNAEFGLAPFFLGQSTYAFLSSDQLIATYTQHGKWHLAIIDLKHPSYQTIKTPYTYISAVQAENGIAVFLAGSPIEPLSVVRFDSVQESYQVLKRSSSIQLDKNHLSIPESISYPTIDQQTAYAFYYPPKNPRFRAPEDELPPLLVVCHGGPTFAAFNYLRLEIQYWTSRGFAVLDVNYGGSTGYGRAYRERLKGKWGIVDVEDSIAGAKYLIERNLVDPKRIAIRGQSAGGYTTLAALTFQDFFQAGASYYGVSDLEQLAQQTHKFESHYLESLIGPYPENIETYQARSPIHHIDQLSRPLILFQGLEDRVVPPNQSEQIVQALKNKGIPVAYLSFDDEAHGFTKSQNIKAAFENELYFYSKIFNFPLHEPITPIPIEDLDN